MRPKRFSNDQNYEVEFLKMAHQMTCVLLKIKKYQGVNALQIFDTLSDTSRKVKTSHIHISEKRKSLLLRLQELDQINALRPEYN